MHKLYENIKTRRLELNLTQAELAKKVGYTDRSSVAKIESGENDLTQSKIVAFAEALNTTPGFLMGWEDKDGNDITRQYDLNSISNIIPIKTKKIPLLGTIACGEPIFANEELNCFIDVSSDAQADFALRAKGDSMINVRVYDGDIVLVRQQPDVDDGEIAAVLIDDEATLKRVYKDEHSVTLVAENPKYKRMVFKESDAKNIRILGKAVAFVSDIYKTR